MKNKIPKNFDKNLKIFLNQKMTKNSLLKIVDNLKKIKQYFLNKKNYFLIIKNIGKNNKNIKYNTIKFSKIFGNLLAQNLKGNKIVSVKPDISKLRNFSKYKAKNTLRYHQTNIGGSIHSDGPQIDNPPRYLIMSCLNQSDLGGESIIVNTKKIYHHLKHKNPDVLKTLKSKFIFERRGFQTNKNKVLKKPIFCEDGKNFKFRYLKEYILAGYRLKNIQLDSKKLNAMRVLDSMLNAKKFQKKYKLKMGDMIILNNNILAHGRTGFSIKGTNKPREMLRIWIKN